MVLCDLLGFDSGSVDSLIEGGIILSADRTAKADTAT
jgi:hypothetical protein